MLTGLKLKIFYSFYSEYFELNKRDNDARKFFYHQIPEHYTWTGDKWQKRKAHFNTVGRMQSVPPSAGDRFYLRILLVRIRGACSFEELRTVKGKIHNTCRVRLI